VVLLKQRPDLLLLFRSQLQIFRQVRKFLIDRLRPIDMLKLLARGGRLPIFLSYDKTSHPEYDRNAIYKGESSISHDNNLPRILDYQRNQQANGREPT